MDKELTDLLARFRCSDDCDEMTVAEMRDLHARLSAERDSLVEAADDSKIEVVAKLNVLLGEVDTSIADAKAAFAAKVDSFGAQTEEVVEEAVVEETAEATATLEDGLAKFTTARPTANTDTDGKEVKGKVMVSVAVDEKGEQIFGGRIENSVDLSAALQNAVGSFGSFYGRRNVASGVYSNEGHVVIDRAGDADANTVAMFEAVKRFEERQEEHLTADGSFCAPVTPDYSFCDLSDTNLDLTQASLPRVRTIRGRVQYMSTPTNDQFYDLWDGIDTNLTTGVGHLFTETDSIAVDPANEATWKVCTAVDCPEQQDPAELEAHYTCVTYKHFTWKAYPEYIDLYTRKALQAHSLKESLHLLRGLQAFGQTVPSFGTFPGSVTGFFSALDIHASAYRDAFWLQRNQILDIILPRWVLNMLRAALARRADNDEVAALRASDSLITSLFASIGLRVNFVSGWQRLATSTDGAGVLNDPIVPGAGAAPGAGQNRWPASFDAVLWVPGAVVLLEDPSWNIGIERLRDTTMQRQNTYSLFFETFYGLATPCPYPVQNLEVEFCPTGASSARETLNCTDLVEPESPSV